jgi:hypothetical protein
MSSIQKIEQSIAALQAQLDVIKSAAAGGSGLDITLDKKLAKAAKAAKKAVAKPRANAGQKTAYAEWTVKMKAAHAAEIEDYIAKRVVAAKEGTLLYTADQDAVKLGRAKAGDPVPEKMAKVGAHFSWIKAYKGAHEEEWLAFKSEFEIANPKSSRASSVAGEESAGEGGEGGDAASQGEKKKGRKKDTELYSPEELVKVKAERAAKRAANKAKKEAGEAEDRKASVMAPAEEAGSEEAEGDFELVDEAEESEEVTVELHPFAHKGVNYLRLGRKGEGNEIEWEDVGDLWLTSTDGERGEYAGILLANGKVDSRPEVLAAPPDLN